MAFGIDIDVKWEKECAFGRVDEFFQRLFPCRSGHKRTDEARAKYESLQIVQRDIGTSVFDKSIVADVAGWISEYEQDPIFQHKVQHHFIVTLGKVAIGPIVCLPVRIHGPTD